MADLTEHQQRMIDGMLRKGGILVQEVFDELEIKRFGVSDLTREEASDMIAYLEEQLEDS